MHGIILASFRGQPGERLVEREDYYLTCDNGKRRIRAHNWRRMMRPGMVVDMSMVLIQTRPMTRDDSRHCPICRHGNPDVTDDDGWIDW